MLQNVNKYTGYWKQMDSPNVLSAVWGFNSPLGQYLTHDDDCPFEAPPSELYNCNCIRSESYFNSHFYIENTSSVFNLDSHNDIYTIRGDY